MKTVYEIAKQTAVTAIKEMIYGKTTRMLWLNGSGPEKRDMDNFSIIPMLMMERFVFRMGSIIVAVESA